MRSAAVAMLFVISVSACSESREQLAQQTVERYLTSAAGGAADRGWSMLHAEVRRDMFGGDMTEYVAAAASYDWTRFKWTLAKVLEDEPGHYQVIIQVEPGSAVPEILTAHRHAYWLMWLVYDRPGPAQINVRMNDEGSGVFFFGG